MAALSPESRIRVWAPPRADGHEGTFVALDTVAVPGLVWRRSALVGSERALSQITDTIPLRVVQRVDVFERRRRPVRAVTFGIIGAALGAGLGYLIIDGATGGNACGEPFCAQSGGAGMWVGGTLGLVAGSVTSVRRRGRWVTVQIPSQPTRRPDRALR
jgi:hypothetical protein